MTLHEHPSTTEYEPNEIMERFVLEDIPDAEFSPYDRAGWEYIVDLPNGQAFRITCEPFDRLEDES